MERERKIKRERKYKRKGEEEIEKLESKPNIKTIFSLINCKRIGKETPHNTHTPSLLSPKRISHAKPNSPSTDPTLADASFPSAPLRLFLLPPPPSLLPHLFVGSRPIDNREVAMQTRLHSIPEREREKEREREREREKGRERERERERRIS